METVVYNDGGRAFGYESGRGFMRVEIEKESFDLYGPNLARFVVAGLRVLASDARGVELGRIKSALACVGPLVEEGEMF